MYSHSLILAILSLRALAGFVLTPHDHKDSHCTKKAIGKPMEVWEGQCVVFQAEQRDAFIKIKEHDNSTQRDVYLVAYSDTKCQNFIGVVEPAEISHKNSTCYKTPFDAPHPRTPWGSVSRNETLDFNIPV